MIHIVLQILDHQTLVSVLVVEVLLSCHCLEKQLVRPKTNHRVENREEVLSCPCFHHQRIKMEAIHLDLLCPCLKGPTRHKKVASRSALVEVTTHHHLVDLVCFDIIWVIFYHKFFFFKELYLYLVVNCWC